MKKLVTLQILAFSPQHLGGIALPGAAAAQLCPAPFMMTRGLPGDFQQHGAGNG
jgi:hypothetical protein